MLGETIRVTFEYLVHEEKAASTGSKVEALVAENAKLRRDLISTMEEANISKEKAKVMANELKVEKQLTMEKDEQLSTMT